jgi:primosomal protein N' (replication factor Y) (superfamily II helicase)
MADYYLAFPGDVMNTALPPAMKMASETRVVLNPDYEQFSEALNDREYLVVEALEIQKALSLSEVSKITGLVKVFPLINGLMEKRIILLQEELDNPYRPRVEKFIRLREEYQSEEKLREAFDYAEKRAPKQLEVIIEFINLSGRYLAKTSEVSVKAVSSRLKNAQAAIDALCEKGILEIYTKVVSRFDHQEQDAGEISYNDHQQKAMDEIRQTWTNHDCVLLHGVTSSGKTEIYIQLIKETFESGRQVLFLLPEIALTTQITRRIQAHFGTTAGVYHSRFNEMERTEVWNNLAFGGIGEKKTNYQLIVGPRSALFLPFDNLGLIIVDEEHETSYKQHDPAPRYHARDAALVLARLHGARVLLGSATPSVESFYNARSNKYGLVTLHHRYGGMQLPEVLVADVKKETRQKTMKSHLSSLLFESVREALDNKKQVILFRNRRGFALHMECDLCNYVSSCSQCDVSMVYHKNINKLRCHYCGYTITPPTQCPSCGSTGIAMKGFGTEKMEEELPLLFPDARIKRMDLDTTRNKNAHASILGDFENKKTDILVGTQMISKGLDFENVGVVGILSADSMLIFPDFRAHERAFQMMAQVSGRAGRKHDRGKVIIQAMDPWHTIIRQVIDNNYEEMYSHQVLERRNFNYPPFCRLVLLTLSHADPERVNKASRYMADELRRVLPADNVLGPEFPSVSRVKAQYMKNILVKLNRSQGFVQQKEILKQKIAAYNVHPEWKNVKLRVNVDPS